jgi:hypothetical protein
MRLDPFFLPFLPGGTEAVRAGRSRWTASGRARPDVRDREAPSSRPARYRSRALRSLPKMTTS